MDEVTITVRPRTVERIIFIIIIIILAALYVREIVVDNRCDVKENITEEVENISITQPQNETLNESEESEENETELPSPEETCVDGIKNQNEVGVDCGGVCGGYWYTNECHTTPQSATGGKITFSLYDLIKNTDYIYHNTTNSPKIKSVHIKIENGKDTDFENGFIEVYVRSVSGLLLMQPEDAEEDVSYARVDIPTVKAGEIYDETLDLLGKYTSASYISDRSYDAGDDVKVEVVLKGYDGSKIGSVLKTISVN